MKALLGILAFFFFLVVLILLLTGSYIYKVFRNINKEQNTTIIIVTHDPRIGESTERCIRILDGQIVE